MDADQGSKLAVTGVACEAISWGIFVPLMLFSVHALIAQGLRGSKPRQMMLTAIVITFSCSSSATMLDLHRLRDQDYTGLRIPSSALDSYTSTGNLVEWVSWRTLQRINRPDCDMEMLGSVARASPCKFGFAHRGLNRARPANHGKVVLLPLNLIFKFMFGLRKIVLPTDLALLPPFAIINLVATGLMGYKAWIYYKDARILGIRPSQGRRIVSQILFFLTESGALYSLYWIVMGISFVCSGRGSSWMSMCYTLDSMFCNISGIYPTLVIVFVLLKETAGEHEGHMSAGLSVGASIRFADGPGQPHSISVPAESHSRGLAISCPVSIDHDTEIMKVAAPQQKGEMEVYRLSV